MILFLSFISSSDPDQTLKEERSDQGLQSTLFAIPLDKFVYIYTERPLCVNLILSGKI